MTIGIGKLSSRGDTIVEVMLSITIMALALGGAYALSTRSFHTAQNTEERTEALALAEGQIEFLRNTGLRGNIGSLLATFPEGRGFCFQDSDGAAVAADTDYCQKYGIGDDIPYNILISYCDGTSGCGPANVFTVSATWDGFSGNQQNLTLYYKPEI